MTDCWLEFTVDLLLGFGLSCTIQIIRTGRGIPMTIPPTLTITFIVLLTILVSHAVVIPYYKFQGRSWYGFYLMAIFVAFTTLNIVIEFTGLFQ